MQLMAQGKDLSILTSMAFCRVTETYSAASTFVVVATNKVTHPTSCSIQGRQITESAEHLRLGASFSNHPKHALKYAQNVAIRWR